MSSVVEFMLIPKSHEARQNPGFVVNRIIIGIISRIVEIFGPESGVHSVIMRQLRVKAAVKIDHIRGVGRPRSVEEQPGLVFSKPPDRMRGICGRKSSRIVVNG